MMEAPLTRFNSWKILCYPEKLKQAVAFDRTHDVKDLPLPIVWHVYPSNICNMNCGFCIMSREKQEHPSVLSREVLFKIIDDAHRLGIQMIHFSGGGEPFLNPDLPFALHYNREAFETPVKIAVSTNGVFLDPSIIEDIDFLRVSLNAGCPETHMKVMGAREGWFDQALRNTAFAKHLASKETMHDVGLAFLITNENWTELYRFMEKARDCMVDFVHIRPAYYPWNDQRNIELMDIMQNKLRPIYPVIERDFGSTMAIGLTTEKFEGYWTKRNYSRCRSTPLSAVLTATGEFVVCQDVFLRFGDYTTMSFEDCWQSKAHIDMIDQIRLETCPRCVETRHNQVIEHFFLKNDVRMEII